MSRYRLPKTLGGHEVEIIMGPVEGSVTVRPLGFPDTSIDLPMDQLEEIPPPPLPPEPPAMRVVLVFAPGDEHGELFRRQVDGLWHRPGPDVDLHPLAWPDLCALGEVVVLGPDVFWALGKALSSANIGRYAKRKSELRAERAQ
jgi:hypothetical protein